MSDLWPRHPLASIVSKVGSGATPKGGEAVYKPSGIPLIRSMNVVFFGFKRDGLAFIDDAQADALKNVEVKPQDVLLNITGASIGRVTLAPKEMDGARVNQHVCIIRPTDVLDPRFLNAYLSSPEMQDRIWSDNYGVTRQALTKQQILGFEIPLPPLKEQKRIADKLVAVLARVVACRDRLDRIPAILKHFRQSVLAAATSGKLTEDWRQATATSIPWTTGILQDLLNSKPRNGYSPRAVEKVTPVKSLTLTATTMGKFRPEHFKYIDEHIAPDSYLWLEPDDILIQRANTLEYVDTSVLYDGPSSGFIYPDLMMKARTNSRVLPRFLLLILQSDGVRNHFRSNATGTAGNMPKINQQTVLSAPACWPSLPEQTEIVRRVETLYAYADRLEACYAAARAQVEKLTPATLAKAFRGELVPQDPNDEPAAALLQRLNASRAAPIGATRGKKAGAKLAALTEGSAS